MSVSYTIHCAVFFSALIFVIGLLVPLQLLRGEEEAILTQDHRELKWIFVPTGNVVPGEGWYDNYDDGSVPNLPWEWSDEPDKLRTSDVCYDNGIYSRKYCPSLPKCDFRDKWGKAKLCINRAPVPDKTFFYVLIMKCIPYWENCDKCLCGKMPSERENEYCRYTDGEYGDDWVHMNCRSPGSVSVMNDYHFNPPNQGKSNRKRRRKQNKQ